MINLKEMKANMVKEAILAETKKQFLIKGIQKTTLRGIAKNLNMALGNIYYYYKSKADLCSTIWQNYTNDFIDRFEDKLSHDIQKKLNGIEKIKLYYDDLYKYFKENPLYFELIGYSMMDKPVGEKSSKKISENNLIGTRRIKEVIAPLYQEGVKDGSINVPIGNFEFEAWSFNISFCSIIINNFRYHEIEEEIITYYVNTYFERLAQRPQT